MRRFFTLLVLSLLSACASDEPPTPVTPEEIARASWTGMNERGFVFQGFAEDLQGGLAFEHGEQGYTIAGPMNFSQIGNLSMKFAGQWDGHDIVGDMILNSSLDSPIESMVSRCWFTYAPATRGFTGACKQRLPLKVQFGVAIIPQS